MNLILKEKLYINHAVMHWIWFVHLIQNKTNTVFIEEKIVLKGFVVNEKS